MAGTMKERPWGDVLIQARTRAEAAVARLDEVHAGTVELTAKRDRRRAETEHAERSRRVGRRVHTEALDLQLALAGLWYRDLLCVALDALELAANVDREDELAADAGDRDPADLRRALELVDDTRQRLALNVTEELACEALGYRLERILAR